MFQDYKSVVLNRLDGVTFSPLPVTVPNSSWLATDDGIAQAVFSTVVSGQPALGIIVDTSKSICLTYDVSFRVTGLDSYVPYASLFDGVATSGVPYDQTGSLQRVLPIDAFHYISDTTALIRCKGIINVPRFNDGFKTVFITCNSIDRVHGVVRSHLAELSVWQPSK